MYADVLVMQETVGVMHVGGAGGPRVCELGHKRGPCGQIHGDAGLCFVSCDARMHGVANGSMESGVMCMGEEPGRKTSILDNGLIKFLIIFF